MGKEMLLMAVGAFHAIFLNLLSICKHQDLSFQLKNFSDIVCTVGQSPQNRRLTL